MNFKEYLNESDNKGITLYANYFKKDYVEGDLPSNGVTQGKPVILATHNPNDQFASTDPDDGEIIQVKFIKPISEVFIDLDDYDLEEFGIEDEEAYDFIESQEKTTLQELIRFGFDPNVSEGHSLYGIYVESVTENEIIKAYDYVEPTY
jgi:hypothetical protein